MNYSFWYESGMDDWRSRLLTALKADGRSDRKISLAMGKGENFVNQFRNDAKSPSVENVLLLAGELGLSLSYLFTGADLTREDEEALSLLLSLSPEGRKDLLKLAQQLPKAAPAE